jgi:hypothetical protein
MGGEYDPPYPKGDLNETCLVYRLSTL